MNILQKIFTDYYEEIKYSLHPRASELDNIEKMINCGDPSFGGAMYICPDHKRVPLQELYERAMAKAKCRSA